MRPDRRDGRAAVTGPASAARPLFALRLAMLALTAACASTSAPAVHVAPVVATHGGAVACVERHAAEIGGRILAQRGNAVDAAVAVAFALAVTWPPAGNVGGGGCMIVAMADGRQAAIDARETAPAAVDLGLFLDADGRYDADLVRHPYLCTGVPGSVAGMELAHAEFGVLPWRDLVQPAVELARDGFVVDAVLAKWIASVAEDLGAVPESRRVFLDPFGGPPRAGDVFVQPDLARTLERIAEHGAAGFYRGPVAEALAADIGAHGGLITTDDLAGYRAVRRVPLRSEFAGLTLLTMPPPSSGGVAVGQILGQVERLGVAAVDLDSAAGVHLYAEASRRAFADRAVHIGDPDFVDVPVDALLADEHLDALADAIDPGRATPSDTLGPPLSTPSESRDTTHLSVVDGDGNAVAFTTTLEGAFGSRAVAAGTGVLLNNQLRDFNRVVGMTTEAGHIGTEPNLPAPGKRPLTSMSPTIVLDEGLPVLVTGSPGNRSIINTVAQIVLRVAGQGQGLADAVSAPRLHQGWFPDRIDLEPAGWDERLVERLRAMGHEIRFGDVTNVLRGTQGCANSVSVDPSTGRRDAVGDPRREGWAVGVN